MSLGVLLFGLIPPALLTGHLSSDLAPPPPPTGFAKMISSRDAHVNLHLQRPFSQARPHSQVGGGEGGSGHRHIILEATTQHATATRPKEFPTAPRPTEMCLPGLVFGGRQFWCGLLGDLGCAGTAGQSHSGHRKERPL